MIYGFNYIEKNVDLFFLVVGDAFLNSNAEKDFIAYQNEICDLLNDYYSEKTKDKQIKIVNAFNKLIKLDEQYFDFVFEFISVHNHINEVIAMKHKSKDQELVLIDIQKGASIVANELRNRYYIKYNKDLVKKCIDSLEDQIISL